MDLDYPKKLISIYQLWTGINLQRIGITAGGDYDYPTTDWDYSRWGLGLSYNGLGLQQVGIRTILQRIGITAGGD